MRGSLKHELGRLAGRDQILAVSFDETGVDATGHEIRMTCGSSKACGVGFDRPDLDSGTGLRKRIRGTLPSISMNDDLCDYRDVQRRDVAALLDAAVDANAFGKAEPVLWPGRWQEARHEVFGVEAGFHCPAGDSELILSLGERLAAGDTQLPFDQILSGNRFR